MSVRVHVHIHITARTAMGERQGPRRELSERLERATPLSLAPTSNKQHAASERASTLTVDTEASLSHKRTRLHTRKRTSLHTRKHLDGRHGDGAAAAPDLGGRRLVAALLRRCRVLLSACA